MRFLAVAAVTFLPIVALAPWAMSGDEAPRARRPSSSGRRRSPPGRPVGAAVALVALVGSAVVAVTVARIPWFVVACTVLGFGAARVRAVAGARARRVRAIERAAPDLVDLLCVAAAAGHPPHRCLRAVNERSPPGVEGALHATCRRLDRGVPLAVAVDELRRGLGALGDPVADALVDAFRTGAPLQPALARVAEVARDRRRRAAEAEARRLPVRLLFPLVCCVLPAFGLLAVVPLVVASLRSLG